MNTTRILAAAGCLISTAAFVGQPAFLFEPTDKSVSVGANVFFQCQAFGDGPIQYQWFKNEAALPGETSDFLFLTQVNPSAAGVYFVVASTVSGSVTSDVATL